MFKLCLIFCAAAQAQESDWWKEIPDSNLHSVIQKGLEQAPDASIAKERVAQSLALAQQQRAGFLPSVGFSWSSNTQPRDALGFGFGLSSLGGIPGVSTQGEEEEEEGEELFTAGTAALQVNIPLDVWGTSFSAYKAAQEEYKASLEDKERAFLQLELNIATAYYDALLAQKQFNIIKKQLESAQVLLNVTTMRQSRSEASSLDVLQQRQQVAAIKTQKARGLLNQRLSLQRLSLLVGANPLEPQRIGSDFIQVHPLSFDSFERHIDKRPDIRAAKNRLEAAKKRRYSAMSAMLPSLSVGGQLSRQLNYSTKTEEWDSIDTYGFSTGVSVTLFQGGARWANFQSAKATERIAQESLRQVEMVANQEFAQIIETENTNLVILKNSEEQLKAAQTAFSEAEKQYIDGIGSLLLLITTQQSLQQAQLGFLQSQRECSVARLQTYRVLGGERLEIKK